MIHDYEELEKHISKVSHFISKEQGKREKILEQIGEIEKSIIDIQNKIDLLEKVSILLQKLLNMQEIKPKYKLNP